MEKASGFLKRGVLWTENFQIWGLRAETWAKIEAVQAKISNFISQWGLVNGLLSSFAWNGTLANRRREKDVFMAAHLHTPFLGQCPLPPKAYSPTSYEGHSQNCTILNLLHLFVPLLKAAYFPKGIKAVIISLWNERNFCWSLVDKT